MVNVKRTKKKKIGFKKTKIKVTTTLGPRKLSNNYE